MDKPKNVLIIGLTLIGLALWGCGAGERPADTGETGDAGEAVTEEGLPEGFELLSGEQFNVEDYKGKVLVLDFWATWCPPCKMEIPDLIEVKNEYSDKGVVIVGITHDEEAETDVPKFARETGMNYVNYTNTDAIDDAYGVTGLPTKVIYDAEGNEVFRRTGYMTKEQLVAEIEKYLPGV